MSDLASGHARAAKCRASVVLVILAGLVAATPTRADDGAIENVGGTARLMKGQGHIRMVSETIRARVSPTDVEVDCVFTLSNAGPADTVLIGFPDQSDAGRSSGPMRSFRSWVDGVEVECDSMLDADHGFDFSRWNKWWTKRVYFAPGAVRVIRDHYLAAPGSEVGGHHWFVYILETGASWAGTIGIADVHVTLDGIERSWITESDPRPHVQGRELRWSLRNFEPGSGDGSPAAITFTWWPPDARARWEASQGEPR